MAMNLRHLCKSLVIALPLLLAAALHAADGMDLSLHLSPAGNDTNPGTAAQPLATLVAAQRPADPVHPGLPGLLPVFKIRI